MDKKFKRNIKFYSQNIDYLKFKNLKSLRSKSMASYIVLKMLQRIINMGKAHTISPHFKKSGLFWWDNKKEQGSKKVY